MKEVIQPNIAQSRLGPAPTALPNKKTKGREEEEGGPKRERIENQIVWCRMV